MVVAALLNVSASFMNGGAGSGLVDFFHGFQVALMMTVMLNLTQFVYWRCKQSRRGSCLQVHTPTMWTLLATIFVNVQPMWILILGSWKLCCAHNTDLGHFTNWTSTGYSFPPWGPDEHGVIHPRECGAHQGWSDRGGSAFWDARYCSGSMLSTFPTQPLGWFVQVFFTWGGFVFMFIGVLQATQLHVKLKKRWRAIRRG